MLRNLHLNIILCIVASQRCYAINKTTYEVKELEAGTGAFSVQVESGVGNILVFKVPENVEEMNINQYNWDVLVEKESDGQSSCDVSNDDEEVDIVVSDEKSSQTFKLPTTWYSADKEVALITTRRRLTLCSETNINRASSLEIIISTRKSGKMSLRVDVKVTKKWVTFDDKESGENAKKYLEETGQLSVSQPVVRYFHTPSLIERMGLTTYFLLEIETHGSVDDNCLCSLVSIQEPRCPAFVTLGMIQRFSTWQSMLNRTSFLVDTQQFPTGFVVVVAASPTDGLCQKNHVSSGNCVSSNCTEASREVILRISANSQYIDYMWAMVSVAAIYLIIFIISLLLSYLTMFKFDHTKYEDLVQMMKDKFQLRQVKKEENLKRLSEFILMVGEKDKGIKDLQTLLSKEDGVENEDGAENDVGDELISDTLKRIAPDFSFDINELDQLGVTYDKEEKYRMKRELMIADLSVKVDNTHEELSMFEKSDLHWIFLIIVSIYYSLPSIQMVLDASNQYDMTGNQDLCYFNQLCQKPLGKLKDSAGVFSNLGYVVFGLMFIFIVYLKKKKYLAMVEKKGPKFDPKLHGVPCQTGVYYAMGLGLVMEGVMSSCYHVCPATISFQFDTTYMYLIAILMFIKLYQGRHPDVSCDAFKSYLALGFALTLEAFSFYYHGVIYWIVFCIIYLIFMATVAINTYNLGIIKYDHLILWNMSKLLWSEMKKVSKSNEGGCFPKLRSRVVIIFLMGSFNLLLCSFFFMSMAAYASNNLLLLFMGNLFLYVCCYVVMKLYSGEKLTPSCWLYLICWNVCSLPSLYFFYKAEQSSDVSPAQSRMMNQPCSVLNFYDYHDIWHFLGGAGVFFTFMFLLNIDEDVKYKRRDRLPVF